MKKKGNKNYNKGKRYEKKEREMYWEKYHRKKEKERFFSENENYYGVESRGSHGLMDLVLVPFNTRSLPTISIQVKSGGSKPTVDSDENLRRFVQLEVPKNIRKLVVWYYQKNGKGKATRIILYDSYE